MALAPERPETVPYRPAAVCAWLLAWLSAAVEVVTTATATVATAAVDALAADELRRDTAAVGESVVDLLTIGTTLLVGALVMSQITSAVPAADTGPFANGYEQILSVLNSSFVLAAILPLVIVAGSVLFYVRRFDVDRRGP